MGSLKAATIATVCGVAAVRVAQRVGGLEVLRAKPEQPSVIGFRGTLRPHPRRRPGPAPASRSGDGVRGPPLTPERARGPEQRGPSLAPGSRRERPRSWSSPAARPWPQRKRRPARRAPVLRSVPASRRARPASWPGAAATIHATQVMFSVAPPRSPRDELRRVTAATRPFKCRPGPCGGFHADANSASRRLSVAGVPIADHHVAGPDRRVGVGWG